MDCAPFAADSHQPALWHLDAARGPSTPSLDHLVGAGQQARGDVKSQGLRRLGIDCQLVPGRRLYREVARLLASEYTIHVTRCAAELVNEIGPVGDQPSYGDKGAVEVKCGQFVSGRQGND